MIFIWLIFVVLMILGCIQIIGRMLPSNYTEQRHDKIEATPSKLWSIIINHAQEKDWRSDVKSIDRLSTGSDGALWQETGSNGKMTTWKTLEAEAPKKLVREMIDSKDFGGRITYSIRPLDEEHSELNIEQILEVKKPWQRIKRFFLSNKAEFIERYIHDVKHRAVYLKEME